MQNEIEALNNITNNAIGLVESASSIFFDTRFLIIMSLFIMIALAYTLFGRKKR